MNFRYC